jgi:hypothetical protein
MTTFWKKILKSKTFDIVSDHPAVYYFDAEKNTFFVTFNLAHECIATFFNPVDGTTLVKNIHPNGSNDEIASLQGFHFLRDENNETMIYAHAMIEELKKRDIREPGFFEKEKQNLRDKINLRLHSAAMIAIGSAIRELNYESCEFKLVTVEDNESEISQLLGIPINKILITTESEDDNKERIKIAARTIANQLIGLNIQEALLEAMYNVNKHFDLPNIVMCLQEVTKQKASVFTSEWERITGQTLNIYSNLDLIEEDPVSATLFVSTYTMQNKTNQLPFSNIGKYVLGTPITANIANTSAIQMKKFIILFSQELNMFFVGIHGKSQLMNNRENLFNFTRLMRNLAQSCETEFMLLGDTNIREIHFDQWKGELFSNVSIYATRKRTIDIIAVWWPNDDLYQNIQTQKFVNPSICKFAVSPSGCREGENCVFFHPSNSQPYIEIPQKEKSQTICRYYALGNCMRESGCEYLHT